MNEYHIIGKRLPRIDAKEKVRGQARYTDDLKLPGMLCSMILRSPFAHARILRIDA
jgi:CO/xanthine dehydrogenase Mo-binding subunit